MINGTTICNKHQQIQSNCEAAQIFLHDGFTEAKNFKELEPYIANVISLLEDSIELSKAAAEDGQKMENKLKERKREVSDLESTIKDQERQIETLENDL